MGELPKAGQNKFIMAEIGYLIKCVEEKPSATVTELKIREFMRQIGICRFGIIQFMIYTDNGR